jgi:hypothetical protein
MMDISALVVNVLYALHQIIEEAEKNYDQLEMDNNNDVIGIHYILLESYY